MNTIFGRSAEKAGEEVKEKLKSDVLGRVRHVSEIAGGILGFMETSKAEQGVLDSLEQAFA